MGAGPRVPLERVDVRVAAINGHLEVLQWLQAHGCPRDMDTFAYAAKLLQWARANGCPKEESRCAEELAF